MNDVTRQSLTCEERGKGGECQVIKNKVRTLMSAKRILSLSKAASDDLCQESFLRRPLCSQVQLPGEQAQN